MKSGNISLEESKDGTERKEKKKLIDIGLLVFC